jgi:hypothetical protein
VCVEIDKFNNSEVTPVTRNSALGLNTSRRVVVDDCDAVTIQKERDAPMRRPIWLVAVTLAAGLAGCGGGGGGAQSGSPLAGGRVAVPIFVTDDPETENEHVWATLFKVEIQNQNGQNETVFDDSAGRTIDLKSLHDASGQRFAFLSNGAVSPGTHTGVRVTVGSTLTLFPRGAANGQAVPLDDRIARDNQNRALISFPLGAPRNLASGSDDLVLDFDLARFTLQNGKILPTLREGERSGLNDLTRHEREDQSGTVANLTGPAPNFTFTLQSGGSSVTVVTDSNTVFFNSDASPNPTLANGQIVEVTGAFNTATNRLAASRVKIEDRAQHAGEAEVEGTPSAVSAPGGTFAVAAEKVRGFVPTQTTVNVVTYSASVFRSNGGIVLPAADFFTALSTARRVEVEGTFNTTTNTLTASRAKLEDEHEGGDLHEGEARGPAVNVQLTARSFTLQPVTEFDGFVLTGNSLNVVTTGSTRFRSDNTEVTAETFFAALSTPRTVQVEGTFSGGTFTASKARIRTTGGNNGGGGNDDGSGHN